MGRFDDRATSPARGPGDMLRWRILDTLAGRRVKDPGGFVTPVRPNDGTALQPGEPSLTWIGHATFVLRLGGKWIATDPIWSEKISGVVQRKAPPGVALDKLPPLDVVTVSHNHFDHLDVPTLRRIGPQPLYVTLTGNAGLLKKAGLERIVELDWWESHQEGGLTITAVPARHWSMRMPWNRNDMLWGGFVYPGAEGVAYHSGDTALFDGFAEIGRRVGPIDWAMLPIGAYEPRWFMEPQHMNPGRRRAGVRGARRAHAGGDALGHVQAHRRAARRAARADARVVEGARPRAGAPVGLGCGRDAATRGARVTKKAPKKGSDPIDVLYAASLDEFVAARNALAAQLKRAGDLEGAARVRKLAKPAASVWAVNQLARGEADTLGELLEAGAALRRDERRALRGEGADAFMQAAREERRLVGELVARAERLLLQAGYRHRSSSAIGRRISQTLHAAAMGEGAAREALVEGRLDRDLEPASGFGDTRGLTLVPAPPKRTKAIAEPAPSAAELRAAERTRQRVEAAQRKAIARADRAVASAERALDKAESDASTHEHAARAATERAAFARSRAQAARERLDKARRERDQLA